MRMKSLGKSAVIGAVFFSTFLAAKAQAPAENPLAPYIPKNIKPYYLDLLMLKDQPDDGKPEAERPQWMQKHLAYIRSEVETGRFVLVGPVTEQGRLRGIAVIKAESVEEAQRVASGDPLVQSGHLIAEVHPILLEDLSGIRFEYPEAVPH
jgi:uncharacterized protein YciI